ncbi:MAG: hypothetical protein ABIF10_00195 [Candidatus Woesearchaeota archaeon]
MIKSFIERENEIFNILESFNKAGLKYVLVGGYAVSAHMHRFSVDADICIDKTDLAAFRNLLGSKSFVLEKRKDLEDFYKGEFESYAKRTKLPVTVDLMVGSIVSRQTNASISFAQLYKHSHIKSIVGIEKSTSARIPIKELLIALKIHSGRMTDARDIVALCQGINFELVARFIQIGNTIETQKSINILLTYFKSENFKDSFKGVFSIEKLPANNIKTAINLLESL